MNHGKAILKSIPLVLVLALIVSTTTLHYATASLTPRVIYQNEYRTELDVYNYFRVLVGKAIVGQVVSISPYEARIIACKTGTITAQATAWGWSAEWKNPAWDCETVSYDSHAKVKIWQKISSWIWSEEGDLWNYVDYYGGDTAFTIGVFVGVAGGNSGSLSLSQAVDLAIVIGEIITIILSP